MSLHVASIYKQTSSRSPTPPHSSTTVQCQNQLELQIYQTRGMYEKKNFTHGKSSGVDIAAKSFDDEIGREQIKRSK